MTMVTEVAASRRDTNSEQETTQTTGGDREQKAEGGKQRHRRSHTPWQDSAAASVDGRDAVGSEAVACGLRLGGCTVGSGSMRGAAGQQGRRTPGRISAPRFTPKDPRAGLACLAAGSCGNSGTSGSLEAWERAWERAWDPASSIQRPASSIQRPAWERQTLQASISPLHMGTALYVHAAQAHPPRLRSTPYLSMDSSGCWRTG
ncbi:hypothetical protein BKA56DRAFT_610179 [Ilyonectria sp. MPI-CAGE-AT-0026]|nr:hypothetical protein BKA56DRAFT_610179 [Ilyonectria sp. MPI-CAGE-AT-0026]